MYFYMHALYIFLTVNTLLCTCAYIYIYVCVCVLCMCVCGSMCLSGCTDLFYEIKSSVFPVHHKYHLLLWDRVGKGVGRERSQLGGTARATLTCP